MGIKVISCFDGMSCGAIAFREMGIDVERYVAYEIDKYAVQVSAHNFPDIEQRGDVFTADFTEFDGFDAVIGGSPCTYWSIAQKNNRETEASGLGWELFSQYVRAVHEAKPKYFLYENNKSMSKEIRASITETFGFEPVLINSALVSAQNRQRLYWVGKRNDDGTYSKVDVKQPEDKGILLRDVLDNGFDLTSNEKAYCLTKSYNPCPWNTIERNQRNMVAEPVCVAQRGRYADTGKRCVKGDGPIEQFYEAREDGKTNAITTVQKDNAVAEPVRIGCYPSPDGTLKNSQGMRLYDINGKSVSLTAQGGGVGTKTGLYAVPIEEMLPFVEEKIPKLVEKFGYLPEMFNAYNTAEIIDKSPTITACSNRQSNSGQVMCVLKSDGKQYPVYEVKNGLITIKDKQYPIKLTDGYYIIRKLTVSECKRLQTVPEWYNFNISNSQAYKCLGNGWTVDVIAHILKSLQ